MNAAKATLHAVIDGMDDEQAEELLDYLNLRADPERLDADELAEVEIGLQQIAAGNFVTLDQLKRELGPRA